MSERWLVTGATGLLGANAVELMRANRTVIGAARSAPQQPPVAFERLDLSRESERTGLVERVGASAVLHAAAVASIPQAEADPRLTHEVNVLAAADLARQAKQVGARFIHISSDEVFDGRAGWYTEDDPTSPQSEYARSKVQGERAVLAANPDALVARVNFFGWSPSGTRSLAEFFLGRLRAGLETPGYIDVVVTTLQVGLLVEALLRIVDTGAAGVVHVASCERVSKYQFGRELAETFGLDPDLILPVRRNLGHGESRATDRSLDTSRAATLIGDSLPTQAAGRDRLLAEREARLPEALALMNASGGIQ